MTNGNNPVVPTKVPPALSPLSRPAVMPSPMAQRNAAAFAEIRKLEEDHASIAMDNEELRRRVDQQNNKIEMLEKALDDERQYSRACARKLVRLAESMSNIGKLTADAEAIMKDAKDWLDSEEKKGA